MRRRLYFAKAIGRRVFALSFARSGRCPNCRLDACVSITPAISAAHLGRATAFVLTYPQTRESAREAARILNAGRR